MGWIQDNIWNKIFYYAHPIIFFSTMLYLILSIIQKNISDIITNNYILIIYDIYIGLSIILLILFWFNTDLSTINNITKNYLDLDLNILKNNIDK